jgi:prephenate dehydrogenase
VQKIGAIPVILDAEKHDKIVAAISHMPHIIAASLVNTVAFSDDKDQNMHTLAAGGFKDITRIASSDTAMWQSICRENSDEILDQLRQFQRQLRLFETAILDGSENLWDLFKSAKDYRNSFAARGSSAYIKEYALYVDIVDKPGSIATIATLLSVNNINIKNIGINNNREQQAGVLQVLFETEEDIISSKTLLQNMNYKVFD